MKIIDKVEAAISTTAERWGGSVPRGFGLYMNQRTHDDICEEMHQARSNSASKRLKRINTIETRDGKFDIHISQGMADGEVAVS